MKRYIAIAVFLFSNIALADGPLFLSGTLQPNDCVKGYTSNTVIANNCGSFTLPLVVTTGNFAPALSLKVTAPVSDANQTTGLLITQQASGTATTDALNYINVTSDNVAITNGNFGSAFNINYVFGGPAMTGGRGAFSAYANFVGPSSVSNTTKTYVGITGVANALGPDGGTGVTALTGKGALYGAGFVGAAATGATNLLNVTAAEFNTAMQTGSSVWAKSIIQLSGRNDDIVAGAGVNAMVWLYNQSGAPTWTDGLLFDAVNNPSPFDTGSTVIHVNGGTIGTGIDLSSATITNFAFKSSVMNVTGATPTNPVLISALSSDTTYGVMSFNGVSTGTGLIGLAGGKGGDSNLYLKVPTGGHFSFQVNGSEVGVSCASVTAATVTVLNGIITHC